MCYLLTLRLLYLRTMRVLIIAGLLSLDLPAVAQESVPELGGASDRGQEVFDERIGRSGSTASSQRIHAADRVDLLPAYSGGIDSLIHALRSGCAGSMAKALQQCGGSEDLQLRFIVEKDGRPTRGELIGGGECAVLVEALHCAMRDLPAFRPGMVDGQRVRVRMEVTFAQGAH